VARRRAPRRVNQDGDSTYVRDLRKKLPVHKHLEDVVASGFDPHPRKTRRIKWIGDYNPMRDAKVLYYLLYHQYNPFQAAAVRKQAAYAKEPDGVRRRLMEAKHERRGVATVEHLGRTYYFEPPHYTCDVDYRDVDILLREGNGEFIDLDDPNTEHTERIYTPDEDVWKLVSVEVMDRDGTRVPNHFKAATGP
jgi:hypothetical protein